MIRAAAILIAGSIAIASAALAPQAASPPQLPSSSVEASARPNRAVLDRYCVSCHNERRKTANLMLDRADVSHIGDNAELWEKVARKIRAGVMPPQGVPRPDKATVGHFLSSIEGALDAMAEARPNPGRTPVFHRLNRSEYHNAVRDLLGLDIDVTSLLPADAASFGFDNIGDVLGVSPVLMESYLTAARQISRVAVGDPTIPPDADTYKVPSELTQDDWLEGLPPGTRGGTLIHHAFPVDGEYVIRVRLARDYNQTIVGLGDTLDGATTPHQLEVTVDGERVQLFAVGEKLVKKGEREKYDGFFAIDPRLFIADEGMEVRVPVKAGARSVAVTFLKRPSAPSEDLRQPFVGGNVEQGDSHGQPYIGNVTISGPYNAKRPKDTPSRHRLFVCQPFDAPKEAACARQIVSTIARRAYRRPLTDADMNILLDSYAEGWKRGGFESGVEKALLRILVSPWFLFRIERDPDKVAPGTAYRLGNFELASRLSFFFWSSIPDDELLALAENGRLADPAVLEQQVRRMLADRRSDALIKNFAGQWLYLRNVAGAKPDKRAFPDFDENLRQAFRRETELLFDNILRRDQSVLDFLTADYTFVNERLARHYGIPNVYGDRFRRVTVSDGVRGGLLGQGSILTVRSYANRTSPVLRGVWILENILGTPAPPPPPNVPDLQDTTPDGRVLSMRERMVQHRSNPACASCHSQIDPLGLPLENFDAVGGWRTSSESSGPIDTSGALPDGVKLVGAAGLKQAILMHSDQFVGTMTEKLLTYALGRGIEYTDAPAIRRITRNAAQNDYRFSAILLGIVQSAPFQMRRAGERASATTTVDAR